MIKIYFRDLSVVDSTIKSFNHFISKRIQQIVDETDDIIPTIIPHEVKAFKIKLGKIEISKPQIIKADGSRTDVYPV